MAIAIFSAGAPASGNGLTTEDQLNDLVLAEQSFKLAMADSADIFGTSAIEMQNGSDAGSLVGRNRILSLGWSISMDATAAEDTDVSASSVTAAASDVTIARRALRLDETGLANAVGGAWGFSPIPLGLTMAGSFAAGRMGLFATAIAGASTNVTSAGAGSIDDLYDIIDSFTTNTGDPGMLVGCLHPFTMAAIRDSMRAEVGPQARREDVQAFLAKGAEMLLGMLIFPSTKVTNASSKHENAFMAAGALSYRYAVPKQPVGGGQVIFNDGVSPLMIEAQRDASKDTYELVANAYDGIVIREQARIRGYLASTS